MLHQAAARDEGVSDGDRPNEGAREAAELAELERLRRRSSLVCSSLLTATRTHYSAMFHYIFNAFLLVFEISFC